MVVCGLLYAQASCDLLQSVVDFCRTGQGLRGKEKRVSAVGPCIALAEEGYQKEEYEGMIMHFILSLDIRQQLKNNRF